MKIRKIVYNIDYVHVITFSKYYREIIAPYFSYDNLQYGIDNENTIHESIRLIFKNEGFTLQFRKDGASLVFEGDITLIKKSNPITTIFLDILEKVKKIQGFTKIVRHNITINCVDLCEIADINKILENNKYIFNPFGKSSEFAIVLEFQTNAKKYKFQFGNYSDLDIVKFDLTPFKTEYNSDLKSKTVGLMCHLVIHEDISSNSLTKFKELIEDGEQIISKYSIKD